ncbi:MAG: metal-dependent transcriptional regulator [Bacilli bacterium]
MTHFESEEDYLERILMLSKDKGNVRAIDIANSMNYSKPSVSIALKKLKEKHYVNVDESTGFITLTDDGLSIASSIFERHQMIAKLLISLGVSEDTALKDACKIEHDLSEETFQRLKEHYKKYN